MSGKLSVLPTGDQRFEKLFKIAPPHNIEAEQALLGAILVNNSAFDAVADIVRPEHFATGVHGRIYQAIEMLVAKGSRADPVTLKECFDQDAALENIGGAGYLIKLVNSIVTIVNARDYAQQIADLWLAREIMNACEQAILEAASVDFTRPAKGVVESLDAALFGATSQGPSADAAIDAYASAQAAIQQAEEAYKNDGRITGLTTGLADLDEILSGLHAGDLIVLGGRPSMGKTALADCIGMAAARHFMLSGKRKAVAMFSLEMPHRQLSMRRLATISGIPLEDVKRGRLRRGDWESLLNARDDLKALPLITDDTSDLSVTEIRARSRRIARRRGLGLVIVDHLGFVRGSTESKRNGETAVISEITKGLKQLAKDLGVPVLALSQLSRDLERRDDKRPMLADLRQSGSIEQDADVVLFVYRHQYYLERARPASRPGEKAEAFAEREQEWKDALSKCENMADIIVAKHRNGRCGEVKTFFHGTRTVFENLQQGGLDF